MLREWWEILSNGIYFDRNNETDKSLRNTKNMRETRDLIEKALEENWEEFVIESTIFWYWTPRDEIKRYKNLNELVIKFTETEKELQLDFNNYWLLLSRVDGYWHDINHIDKIISKKLKNNWK